MVLLARDGRASPRNAATFGDRSKVLDQNFDPLARRAWNTVTPATKEIARAVGFFVFHVATGFLMEAYPRYYLPLAAIIPLAAVSLLAAIERPRIRAALVAFLIAGPILFRLLGGAVRIAAGARLSCGRLADMHDGGVVGVETFPLGQSIEQRDRRPFGREQRRTDLVLLEQREEAGKVLQRHRPMVTRNESAAIEFGAAVDKRRDARMDQVAAKVVLVQQRTCLLALERAATAPEGVACRLGTIVCVAMRPVARRITAATPAMTLCNGCASSSRRPGHSCSASGFATNSGATNASSSALRTCASAMCSRPSTTRIRTGGSVKPR